MLKWTEHLLNNKASRRCFREEIQFYISVDFTEIGGVNYIADIMNNMDRGNEKYIFDELSKKDVK